MSISYYIRKTVAMQDALPKTVAMQDVLPKTVTIPYRSDRFQHAYNRNPCPAPFRTRAPFERPEVFNSYPQSRPDVITDPFQGIQTQQ